MNLRTWKARLASILVLALLSAGALVVAMPAPEAEAAVSFCQPQGSAAGECSDPRGIATDFETGRVYVADRANQRVSVFEPNGSFVLAFGWDVIPGGGTGLETCTTATTCQAGSAGSGAGQLFAPTNIAVDNTGGAEQGTVYVTTGNYRVNKFEIEAGEAKILLAFGWGVDTGANELQSCTTASTCQAGIKGGGECQLEDADIANIDAVSVGPGGNVFVADSALIGTKESEGFTSRVEKFSPAGACLGETVLIEGNAVLKALAVDSEEDLYVSVERVYELRKYEWGTAEKELCGGIDPGILTTAIGLDPEGHLFVSQVEKDAKDLDFWQVITEYEPDCDIARRFAYGQIENGLDGLAAHHTAEGDLFAGERSEPVGDDGNIVSYLSIPDPGPIVAPPSVEADPVRSVWAAVKAEINPEGKATTYRVDYVDEESWETEGGFSSPDTRSSGEIPLGATDFRVHAAEATAGCKPFTQAAFDEGKCLVPETTYRYRIVATNADGQDEVEGAFTTKPPIEFGDVYATDVGTDTATINAEVNPFGAPATGHFEYVTESQFEASGFAEASRFPAEGEIALGSLEVPTAHSALLYPLPPGASYRYRFIADNPFVAEPLASEVRSFTTFRAEEPTPCPANEAFRIGPSALLPDCRAYELVSPLDKDGGDIVALGQIGSTLPAVLSQSAVSGDRLAYGSYRSFGDAASAPFTTQYVAARNPPGHPEAGWQSHAITPPRERNLVGSPGFLDFEFRAFSEDLCEGWLVPMAEPPLAEGAIPGYTNLYRRTDTLCGGGPDYEALSTAKPQKWLPGEGGSAAYAIELQGVSEDGATTAFVANDSLEGSGAPANPTKDFKRTQLYVKGPEAPLRFACVEPGGAKVSGECSAGTGSFSTFPYSRMASLTNALAADGSRLFWTAAGQEGRIYLRTNPLGAGGECSGPEAPCTTHVSKAGEEASGTSQSRFWTAAEDGSRAFFTATEPGRSDLYEFVVEGAQTNPIAGEVEGLVGASEDATRAYFASREALTGPEENENGEAAVDGEPNLYFREAGEGPRFIGILDEKDVGGGSDGSSATAPEPRRHNGRVSPDGLHAAFMSRAPLTGYDNTDAVSGKADSEVFVYDAAANEGEGRLICASCNPSGARPAGINAGGEAVPFWVAARLPVVRDVLYASHLMADDGSRLLFESQDALVARDTNGRFDVYQWEEAGTGGCEVEDATFSAVAGGCIDLISSGQSLKDSELIDASPTGNDVFFTTLSGLVPQDYGLTDVYDARIGGGLPVPPPKPTECEGESCQSPPAAPGAPTPASATYEGPGDERASTRPRRRCPKGKRKARRAGKVRCVARQTKKSKLKKKAAR